MTTDILIPVWNQPETTLQCVDSVWKYSTDYRVIFVDDCSDTPTATMLDVLVETYKDWTVIHNPQNLGFPKSMNVAMHATTADRVCWLNTDTVVTSEWLWHMNDTMTRFAKRKCGFVVPNSTFQFNPAIRSIIGMCPKQDYALNHVLGFCLLIDRAVMEDVGYLDEVFSEGYGFDETDYFLRAQQQGWTARLSHRAYVYHRAFTSFDAQHPDAVNALYAKNKQIFHDKWKDGRRVIL